MYDDIQTGSISLYIGFSLLVIVLLAIDFLLLRNQGSHKVSVKEAAGGEPAQPETGGRW